MVICLGGSEEATEESERKFTTVPALPCSSSPRL